MAKRWAHETKSIKALPEKKSAVVSLPPQIVRAKCAQQAQDPAAQARQGYDFSKSMYAPVPGVAPQRAPSAQPQVPQVAQAPTKPNVPMAAPVSVMHNVMSPKVAHALDLLETTWAKEAELPVLTLNNPAPHRLQQPGAQQPITNSAMLAGAPPPHVAQLDMRRPTFPRGVFPRFQNPAPGGVNPLGRRYSAYGGARAPGVGSSKLAFDSTSMVFCGPEMVDTPGNLAPPSLGKTYAPKFAQPVAAFDQANNAIKPIPRFDPSRQAQPEYEPAARPGTIPLPTMQPDKLDPVQQLRGAAPIWPHDAPGQSRFQVLFSRETQPCCAQPNG
jgi:hypothetical protein